MKLIRPCQVTETNIVATNIPDDQRWDSATNYAKNDTVLHLVAGEDVLWEAASANVNSEPSNESTVWVNIGPAKKLCPFDLQVGLDKYRVIETVASRTDSITFRLSGLKRISGIYMDGLNASSVAVNAVIDGNTVLDLAETLTDRSAYNGSFWRWCFTPIVRAKEFLKTGLNIPENAELEITLAFPGSTVEVASIVLGAVEEYPSTRLGASRTIKSRSIKKTDGLVNSLKRRPPSRKVTYPIVVRDNRGEAFANLLDDLDGTAAVYIGSEKHPELTVFGFHTSATLIAEGAGRSEFTIEVESL